MIKPVFSVRDLKVGFGPPFCDTNIETAKRGFFYAFSNDDMLRLSVADYRLYKIGDFDTDSGEFVSHLPDEILDGATIVFKEDA